MRGATSAAVQQQARRIGGPGDLLTEDQIRGFVRDSLDSAELDGLSVCLVVPDGTRSCPLPLLIDEIHRCLTGRVTKLTAIIALGTHAEMDEQQLARHLGHEAGGLAERYPGLVLLNHAWWDPATFASLGTIPGDRIEQISGGLLSDGVQIRINRAVVEHDVALVIGPVFPHEVVGFSGGNKYFFPGVGGQEIIDISHWLGALITSADMIGMRGITPVRALINEAASMIPARKLALCVVTASGRDDLHAVSFGDTDTAWSAAAEISAESHVTYLDAPVSRVLSIMPTMYDDIWTAAKGFYKLEPVVADGGEVIIYAPHVTQISRMHPEIMEIGYHCRDYFIQQWDTFKHLPWGVLAHSTHVRGAGTYDQVTGEQPRVKVTLATGIPRETVNAVGLDYLDPDEVEIEAYESDGETLVVPNAGELLFRLR